MEMERILAVFNAMQNNNLTATPPTSLVSEENSSYKCDQCYDTGDKDCSICNGKGYIDEDWMESRNCAHCDASGKIPCRCKTDRVNEEQECWKCNGSGVNCPDCQGAGRVEKVKNKKINEDWGSSDTSIAMQQMKQDMEDYPSETLEDAAYATAERFWDQMGYSNVEMAKDRLLQLWELRKNRGRFFESAEPISKNNIEDLYTEAMTQCNFITQQFKLINPTRKSIIQQNLTNLGIEFLEIGKMAKNAMKFLIDGDKDQAIVTYQYAINKLDDASNKWGTLVVENKLNKLNKNHKCSFCDGNKYVPEPLPTKDLGNGSFTTGSRAVPCKYCNKNGKQISESKEVICKNCSADGVIPCQACKGKDGNFECKECFGEGEITCNKCKGKGYVEMKKVNECDTIGIEQTTPSNLTINTSYDSLTNKKTINISADNERAEELDRILKLSGIIPDRTQVEEPIEKDNFYGLREDFNSDPEDEIDFRDSDESVEPGLCCRCSWPIENDGFDFSGLCYDCYNKVSEKLEDNYLENDRFNESFLRESSEYIVRGELPGLNLSNMRTVYLHVINGTPTYYDFCDRNMATKFSDLEEAKQKAAHFKRDWDYIHIQNVKVVPLGINESSIDVKAIKNFDCPRCKAKKGDECHTSEGERIVFPHEERVKKAEKVNESKYSTLVDTCKVCGDKLYFNNSSHIWIHDDPTITNKHNHKAVPKQHKENGMPLEESSEPKRIKHPGVQCAGKDCKKAARWRMTDGKLMCDGCKSKGKINEWVGSIEPSVGPISRFLKEKGFKLGASNNSYSHWTYGNFTVTLYPGKFDGKRTPRTTWAIYSGNTRVPSMHGAGLTELERAINASIIPMNESWQDKRDNELRVKGNFGKCVSCGEDVGKHNEEESKKCMDKKKDKNMNEALTPKRENSGLNGASRGWANSPNEQIAGWRALVDDADGPNKPKEMLNKIKGNDNTMTVVANEKDKPLHENKQINVIAEKLSKKFTSLNENEARYAANQLNFNHVERKLKEAGFKHNPEKEAEINRSAHIFTGNNGSFVSVSKDGKWDWAYHHDETLDEGSGKASLLDLIYQFLMDEYNSGEWESEPSLEDELEANAAFDEEPMMEDSKSEHDKAVDAAFDQNEKYGKMLSALDKQPNIFSKAAKRMGKVSKDYKPAGVPVREK